MNVLRWTLRIVLPLLVLGLAFLAAVRIVRNAERPLVVPPPTVAPPVRVTMALGADVRLDVGTFGTVEPLRTVELAAQVGGRIVATSPALRSGGTFRAGDVLIEIEAADYELQVVQQEAQVARAELRLLQERAEADASLRAWRGLEGERAPDPLVAREPQIKDAETAVAAARAALQKARLDLARTKVVAPFAGRVRSVAADIGQTVQPAQRLAVLLDTSAVEVRLPVPLDEAAFVDLPLDGPSANGPTVELETEFAGRRHAWRGRVVRIEGELDRRTRQLTVVARVEPDAAADTNGYGTGGEQAARPPLLVGTFVDATIRGFVHEDVVVVPRRALRNGDELHVVRPVLRGIGPFGMPSFGHVLERRRIELLRVEAERVVVKAGVAAGELVSVTELDAPSDGMALRIAGFAPPAAAQDQPR